MSGFFIILMIMAMAAVVISLLLGFFVMAKGGETDRKYSNKLMQARIVLQGAAILMFVLAVLAAKH